MLLEKQMEVRPFLLMFVYAISYPGVSLLPGGEAPLRRDLWQLYSLNALPLIT